MVLYAVENGVIYILLLSFIGDSKLNKGWDKQFSSSLDEEGKTKSQLIHNSKLT